jgi:hypothetical protein
MVDRTEFRTARSWTAPTIMLALLLLALPAGAVAEQGQALVRVVHLAPGAPNVDVYVDGTRMIAAVPFKTASKYHRMPASTHMLVLRPAGSAANSTPSASQRVSVAPGVAYTVVLLGTPVQPQIRVAKDDFSAPPPGKARLRIINAAPQSPPLDVGVAGGPVLFRNVTFGMVSNFVPVTAGRFSLEVRRAGTSTVLFTQGASTLPAGTIITVAGTITSTGKIEMLPILDAAGAGNLPQGGVATGAGGTANTPASPVVGPTVLVALLALIMVAGRRRLRSRTAADRGRSR